MRILFVHVTDIHWSSSRAPEDARALLAGSAIANATFQQPNAIVMIYSGDFVWSGKEADYNAVFAFLKKFEASIQERFPDCKIWRVLCPGNHDCEIGDKSELRQELVQMAFKNRLLEGGVFEELLSANDNFFAFAEKLSPSFADRSALWHSVDRRLGWRSRLEVEGKKVEVIGLNTSWLSPTNEESGHILFPFDDFMPPQSFDVCIALLHHPLSWLEANAAHNLREKLLENADLVFSGHEHQQLALTIRQETPKMETKILEGPAFFDHVSHEKDGFGVFQLDIETRKSRAFHLRWVGDGYNTYVGGVLANPQEGDELFELETALSSPFHVEYSEDFGRWTNDPELPLRTKNRTEVRLSEVYVFPDLRKVKFKGSVSDSLSVTSIEFLAKMPFTLVLGPSNSGKTALAKHLLRYCVEKEIYPLYLDGRKLKAHIGNIEGYLEKNIQEQYGPAINAFKAKSNQLKILIIDDFHAFASKSKSKKVSELLNTLRPRFGKLLILAHDIELGPLDLLTFLADSNWGNLNAYLLQPFSFKKRNELIARWLDLNDEIDSADLAIKKIEINRTLDVIIGRNFVQPFPSYLLAVLQGIEIGGDIDHSTSTHGHLYEIFIKTCLAKKATATNYNIFSNFLGMLAFKAFVNQRADITDDFIGMVHADFESEYDLDRPLVSLRKDLLDVGLVRMHQGCYYFSEQFVLYYFVAYYIKDRLSDLNIRAFVGEMASKLWIDDYAHVMLFLVHLSKDEFIVDEMLEKTSSMFKEFEEARLSDDLSFLSNYGKEVVDISCAVQANEDDRISELALIQNETLMPEYASAPPRHYTEVEVDELARFNAAIKGTQLIGQVLKNFPASFKSERKAQMAQQSINLGLRCLGFYFDIIKEDEPGVLREISEILVPELRSHDEREKLEQAKEFVLWLCRHTAFGVIKRISYSIGSRELGRTYEKIFSGEVSDAYKLIQISLMLDHQGAFPEQRIEGLYYGWLSSNYFAALQLKMLVRRHLRLFEVPLPVKQRLSASLNIRLLPVEESGSGTKIVKRSD